MLTRCCIRIRKVRPSSLGNIFQIMEESPYEESSTEKPSMEKPPPPAAKPMPRRPFFAYASKFWLSHTSTIQKDDSHYKLWKRLVLAPNALAPKPWTWKSRSWSEPEDPDLLQAIVEYNHGALLGTSSPCPTNPFTFRTPFALPPHQRKHSTDPSSLLHRAPKQQQTS